MTVRGQTKTHVVGLDLLRLFAALLVVVYHFAFWHWTRNETVLPGVVWQAPSWGGRMHFGWVGVEVFFVISGFVIAFSASGAGAGAFLRGRVLRLAPGAWICASVALVVYAVVLRADPGKLGIDYAATLAFWPLRAIDGVYWTLGIEVSFYALVYVLLRIGRGALMERVMTLVGLASGLFWVAALGMSAMSAGAGGWLGAVHDLVLRAEWNRELQLLLVQHGCLFGLGVVSFQASALGMTRARAAALAGLGAACLLEIVGQNAIIEHAAGATLSPVPALLTWLVAMAAFAAAVAFNAPLLGWLGARARIVRFLGSMTYPLYLVHNPVALGLAVVLAPALGLAGVGAGVAGAVVCAALIARFAEPAVRGVLSRLWPEAAAGPAMERLRRRPFRRLLTGANLSRE